MIDHGLQGHYAGFATRLVAYAIDIAIISVTTIVVAWVSVSLMGSLGVDLRDCPPLDSGKPVLAWVCVGVRWAGVAAGATFPLVYALFFWSNTGQSPGKAVMGVRIVRLDGKPMTLWISMVRLAGYFVGYFTLGLGFYVILSDDRRQGWHDKLAQTCVIYSWKAHGSDQLMARFR